jgi:hypothetical protein
MQTSVRDSTHPDWNRTSRYRVRPCCPLTGIPAQGVRCFRQAQPSKGGDEAAVLPLWREKRARGFFRGSRSPTPGPPPFFVDELDAGGHSKVWGFVTLVRFAKQAGPQRLSAPPLHAQGADFGWTRKRRTAESGLEKNTCGLLVVRLAAARP